MSFNVGDSRSRFVAVSDVTMRFQYSEKVLFADLRTSRKTGKFKTEKNSGEVLRDGNGEPFPEREYKHWEGRFVGNAFEAAKGLKNGQKIDIINGWLDRDDYNSKDGIKSQVFICISDFTLSNAIEDDEQTPSEEEFSSAACESAISNGEAVPK